MHGKGSVKFRCVQMRVNKIIILQLMVFALDGFCWIAVYTNEVLGFEVWLVGAKGTDVEFLC